MWPAPDSNWCSQEAERIDLTKYDSLPAIEELLKAKGFTKSTADTSGEADPAPAAEAEAKAEL